MARGLIAIARGGSWQDDHGRIHVVEDSIYVADGTDFEDFGIEPTDVIFCASSGDTSELDGIAEAIRQREIRRDRALGLCRALARTEPHGDQERDFIDEIRQRFSNGEPETPEITGL